jgi:hypothetical protein
VRVVGVDQSYTGFGYCNGHGSSFKKGFPASKNPDPIARLLDIRDWYVELLSAEMKAGGPVHVFMEGYAFGAKAGREQAGELGGMVKIATVETVGTSPIIVPPTNLKKFVTTKGNAKKNEMLLGVYKRWNVSYSDDNVADAYALRQFGLAFLDLREDGARAVDYHKYEIDAIEPVLKSQ